MKVKLLTSAAILLPSLLSLPAWAQASNATESAQGHSNAPTKVVPNGFSSMEMPNVPVDTWVANQRKRSANAVDSAAITIAEAPTTTSDTTGRKAKAGGSTTTEQMAATSLATAAPATANAPTTINEMARALKYDPDLIYEFVRDNIEIYPIFGVHKGARGALIDGSGTNFDQIELFVKLLRASGYTAKFVQGVIDLTPDQVRDFYGMPTDNGCRVQRFFDNGQVPVSVTVNAASGCDGAVTSVRLVHMWARVTLPEGTYDFDPSLKSHQDIAGIDLTAATGYNRAELLTLARNGATVTADSIEGLNRTAVRSKLDQLSGNLANYIRQNKPDGGLNEILGGREIARKDACFTNDTYCKVRRARLTYQNTGYSETIYTGELPTNLRVLLRVTFAGVAPVIVADSAYGRRLTISPNANLQPELRSDGLLLATGNALPAGTETPFTLEVFHQAYASTFANNGATNTLKSGETHNIMLGLGPVSPRLTEIFLDQAAQAADQGIAPGAEPALGASLAAMGADWLAQFSQTTELVSRVSDTTIHMHHEIGLSGERGAPYFDLDLNRITYVKHDGNVDTERGQFMTLALTGSAFESGVLEQTLGVSGMSTISLLDKAIVEGQRIYRADSANYAASVEPNLVNCDAKKADFSTYVNAGLWLLLPRNCGLVENQWSGVGYLATYANASSASVASIIDGDYLGGYPSVRLLPGDWGVPYDRPDRKRPRRPQKDRGDPVQMPTGAFVYNHDDLSVGTGAFPYELSFRKSYSSSLARSDGPLGKGWSHNFDMRAAPATLALQGLGEDSPIDAATSIVHILVGVDLLSDPALPVDSLATQAVSANWFADRLQNNAVVVRADGPAQVFTRLPDGTFNAPPTSSSTLTQNPDGSFLLSTLNKETLAFDSNGLATKWSSPTGLAVKFAYTDDKLTGVSNSLGRSLAITYLGDRIASVGDGHGRSVGYGYDANGNLVTYTDATSQQTTFEYDLPGRMTRFFTPATPTVAQVNNTYDSLGRVMQQVDADGQTWTYHIGGTRSELVTPMGRRLIDYFGPSGETFATYEDIGVGVYKAGWDLKAQYFEYDGRSRLVRSESTFEPTVELAYDDATCAGVEKRCTHNIRQSTRIAKRRDSVAPVSPNQVLSFSYEPLFNRIATSTDPKGAVTDYAYDTATGNLLSVTLPAPVAGATRPLTSFVYSSFAGAPGFDPFMLPTQVTERINSSTTRTRSYAYDAANGFVRNVVTEDVGGIASLTGFQYDAIGNLLSVDGPRTDVADLTSFTYDAERRLTSTQDALGRTQQLGRDAEGQVVRLSAQVGSTWLTTCRTLTPSGKISQEIGTAEVANAASCPADTGVVAVTDNAYDGEGNLALKTINRLTAEGGDKVAAYKFSPSGDLIQVSNGVGTSLEQITFGSNHSYEWLTSGNPYDPWTDWTVEMPSFGTRYIDYDGVGRFKQFQVEWCWQVDANGTCHADNRWDSYEYDVADKLTKLTRTDSGSFLYINYAYDALGRLSTFTPPEAAARATYTYDTLGRVLTSTAAANGGITVSFAYDALDRVASETTPLGTVSYQYDKAGNRTRITWPGGFYVTYSYDALNRMTEVRENGTTLLASYAYDDLSRRTSLTYGNGTSTTYTYDGQSRLATLGINLGGTSGDVTWTYGYDQAGALTSQTSSNGTYDWNGHYNVTRPYVVDKIESYLSSGANTLTYDGRRNLSGDGTWTFNYDTQNRLMKAVVSQGPQANYTYDTLGRLYSRFPKSTKDTIRYLYSGQQLIGEYNASGVLVRRYIPGAKLDEVLVLYEGTGGTTKSWVYTDRLGSTVAVANASGTPAAAYSYGPYGEPNTTTGVPLRYTGRPLDPDTGLYYYRARWYSPYLGRFLSHDPSGIEDGPNLYAYVGNDPLNYDDPMGLSKQDACGLDRGEVVREFAWGAADSALFGYGDELRETLGIDPVDMDSLGYEVGNFMGSAAILAAGVGGGIKAAGSAGKGIEFSHAIPARSGGPRTIWNGNYVTVERHALSDPYRYRFMPRSWKETNPMPNRAKQLWDRTPNTVKGTAAGATIAGAGLANSGC